jgi:hypothetical protein
MLREHLNKVRAYLKTQPELSEMRWKRDGAIPRLSKAGWLRASKFLRFARRRGG